MDPEDDVPLHVLREITDNFSAERKLGEGAFGVVYKGVTKNGDDVAVKMLRNANLDYKQFRNEFCNIRKLKHQNIVKVLGYCYHTEQKPFIMPDGSKVFVHDTYRALCFDYLHNGTLQKHLSDELCALDWHTRFRIIKGICEGLRYIHEELEEPIYHLDLKPDNILLDKDMVPKIADFGMSRIFHKELSQITRNPYGTPGYQPPEYIDKGEITRKFDIFSLGVIIIRIVSGLNGYPKCLEVSSDEFINQVQKDWRNKLEATCADDFLLESYCHQVEICTQISLNCVEIDSHKRPDIVKITENLNELEIDIGTLPQKGCHQIVSRMTMHNDKIETRMVPNDITGPHHNFNLKSGPSCKNLEFDNALETSSDVVELIVGRTEEKEKIMTYLCEAMSKKISILPIHGIGGIGKTTFARLIYNDPKFKSYSQVWVDLSQRFDCNKICESIISQLSRKEILTNDRKMIYCHLTELLSGKKIFIVLDDLWEDNQFQLQELKDMLYNDDSNIIILVTTRSELVAERICTNLQPYKILPLTNDMCWDIIKQRSGFEDRSDKEQLMGIGREIAQKCGGVALAALSLGFTLRSMNIDQWMKVKDNDIWNELVSKDLSLPNHVLASLRLSYSYMSPCLKPCFTYCATFPKGHKIDKHGLIYQWISLDFIKPTKLLSNIQLCEKNIVQLLGLSFFQQPVSPKTSEAYYKQPTFFTMHDLVHDLAISLLGNQILDQSKEGNTRRSSCQYALLSDCSKPLESCLSSHRSLVALRFLDGCRSKLTAAAFAPAMFLRVLDLRECVIQRLPDSIGQLKQLRYLNAPGIRDEMNPECITKLSNLIYLSLQGSDIGALPKSIGELENLMHLDLSNCLGILELPVSLRNLEKLAHLNLSDCFNISGVPELLQKLSRLEHLNLSRCGRIEDLTRAMKGLTELQYLNLSGVGCCGLKHDLVNLTKLRYLNLEQSLDKYMTASEAEFDSLLECISSLSNLEYLNLGSNGNLYTIPESIGNLTALNTLDLSYCNNLRRLPASVSAISSLKFLLVPGCSKLDKSTLPQNKSGSALLPHFVVHARDCEPSSNISELEDKHPILLEISRLENVKSAEEAKRIKLAEKQSIKSLDLAWTGYAKRFVDDREVLRKLEPPGTLKRLTLKGYNSVSFPSWTMSIATYLPHLEKVVMEDLPSCNVLPPFGQLPNLKWLEIRGMDSIRKIDGDFYGIRRAFPRLLHFSLSHMECLEEWNAEYSFGEEWTGWKSGMPELREIIIDSCPLLRFKACSPPGKGRLFLSRSDQVVSSWENIGHANASSYAATTRLSLECLRRLEINGCPGLVQWFKTWENKMQLAHIKEIIIDGEPLSVTRSERMKWNVEELKNMTREAIGTHTNHRTLPLSRVHRFFKAKDDESKYEREALRQHREVLGLSRDFELLMPKDEMRNASKSGHVPNPLENLSSVQQFSLGCWTENSTMPGTQRNQRRRKPAAMLVRRKRGTVPPASPVAGPLASGSTPSIPLVSSPVAINLQCPARRPSTLLGSMYTFTATACLPLPPMAISNDESKPDMGSYQTDHSEE
ncbi:unnamed protein product [Urochloa decumbens]|uniref:Protein kinase domain-containing protein n=1 Tax=Urochloa decumbens TaxID=240449 RepID=A0ABC9ASG3_9POAL